MTLKFYWKKQYKSFYIIFYLENGIADNCFGRGFSIFILSFEILQFRGYLKLVFYVQYSMWHNSLCHMNYYIKIVRAKSDPSPTQSLRPFEWRYLPDRVHSSWLWIYSSYQQQFRWRFLNFKLSIALWRHLHCKIFWNTHIFTFWKTATIKHSFLEVFRINF